jgi:hypothetical protein
MLWDDFMLVLEEIVKKGLLKRTWICPNYLVGLAVEKKRGLL